MYLGSNQNLCHRRKSSRAYIVFKFEQQNNEKG